MVDFIFWLIFINIIGWLAFPVCYTFFKQAFDRGYTAAKVVGLLLWGYFYWMGNLSGALANDQGGALAAAVLLLTLSIFFVKKNGLKTILAWIGENKQYVIFHEAVFLIAFLVWAIVRGANPEISGTEKPMELAFINGIFRSPTLPPNDPWLSGYSISYYYFGYLMVAAIMQLIGTASGTAFNLAIALTFALVAATSSGILINLLVKKEIKVRFQLTKKRFRQILLISLMAPLCILIVSNAEGFLEMLHSRGILWETDADGQLSSGFWQWLDIQDISQPPSLPLDWKPSRVGGSWWWRASRVLQDYNAVEQSKEIIDEFPFFSFLLADLHPHVLAMPFVLLAIYTGFYLFQNPFEVESKKKKYLAFFKEPRLWFLAFLTGSLIFLNTWDFPIYFGLITLAFILPAIREYGWKKERIGEYLSFTIPFGVACILVYLPFLLSLSSQAGGLLPSLIYRTRAVHFLVMFFPQIALLTGFLLVKFCKRENKIEFIRIFLTGLMWAMVIFMFSLMVPTLSQIIPNLLTRLGNAIGLNLDSKIQVLLAANQSFLSIFGADNVSELLQESIDRFLRYPFMLLFLLLVFSSCLFLLFHHGKQAEEEQRDHVDPSDQYVLLLILVGVLLAAFPEFFYLKDQFGWRMNTIFKFYFQVWILFSLAGAYAVGNISYITDRTKRISLSIGSVLVIAVGLVYPAFSIVDKTNSFRNVEWSLDGNQYYENSYPGETAAIDFLSEQPYGIVVEAVGGSYTGFGRVSRLSGYPTVLGWPGHELQWRGGSSEMGSRESDIAQLYETNDWETAKSFLDQYNINYVFISSLERSTYQVREAKFAANLTQIYKNEDVVIYSYSGIDY